MCAPENTQAKQQSGRHTGLPLRQGNKTKEQKNKQCRGATMCAPKNTAKQGNKTPSPCGYSLCPRTAQATDCHPERTGGIQILQQRPLRTKNSIAYLRRYAIELNIEPPPEWPGLLIAYFPTYFPKSRRHTHRHIVPHHHQ